MELTLEKVMLMVVGLCFASLICVPLIQSGVTQISDQYANSQFQDLVGSIDSEIRAAINGTGNTINETDSYVPQGVTINSTTSNNTVTYYFNSDSGTIVIQKTYLLSVIIDFNYNAGWYRIKAVKENATLVTVGFTPMESH